QDAQNVAVREQQAVAADRGIQAPSDDAIDACPDLLGGLAARPRSPPDRPAWHGCLDVARRSSLQLAVVPLPEVVDAHRVAEAGDPRSLRGTRHGTREHEVELVAAQALAQFHGLFTAGLGQGDVGPTGVLSRPGPLRIAVADQVDLALRLRAKRVGAHRAVAGRSSSSGRAAK